MENYNMYFLLLGNLTFVLHFNAAYTTKITQSCMRCPAKHIPVPLPIQEVDIGQQPKSLTTYAYLHKVTNQI